MRVQFLVSLGRDQSWRAARGAWQSQARKSCWSLLSHVWSRQRWDIRCPHPAPVTSLQNWPGGCWGAKINTALGASSQTLALWPQSTFSLVPCIVCEKIKLRLSCSPSGASKWRAAPGSLCCSVVAGWAPSLSFKMRQPLRLSDV